MIRSVDRTNQLLSTRRPGYSRATAVLLFCCACGMIGCGLNWNMFVTPVYRIPPGYSETYRRSLEEDVVPIDGTEPQTPVGSKHGPYFAPENTADPSMPKPAAKTGATDRGADRSVDLMPKSSGAKAKTSGGS